MLLKVIVTPRRLAPSRHDPIRTNPGQPKELERAGNLSPHNKGPVVINARHLGAEIVPLAVS